MAENIFSSAWHRVADLKPRLRSPVAIHRHIYRGQVWYVLQDPLTGAHYRFDPAAHFLIGLLDGERTMRQVWDAACDRLGDDAPTQDETIQVLAQLHGADVLLSDIAPDAAELFRRRERHAQTKVRERLASPFSLRLPLFDPNRFLVRPLLTPAAAVVWLLCVLSALVLTGLHWPELSHDIAERTLAPKNLLLLVLTYPLVKSLHEFGHAFATKVWGGAVHEMGVSTEARLAYKSENLLLADLQRAMPSATDRLPAKSLGTAGGGRVAVDPFDDEGLRSTERLFQFDVALPAGAPTYYFGQRAYVRFEHGDQTLAAQWFRSLRQLFLARFHG